MVIFRGSRGSYSTSTMNLTPEGRKSFGLSEEPSPTQNYRANVKTQAGSKEGSISWTERPSIQTQEYPEAGSQHIHLDSEYKKPQ